MKVSNLKLLYKWFSILTIYLMALSVFSTTFAVTAPRNDQEPILIIESLPTLNPEPPKLAEDEYIVEMIRPAIPEKYTPGYFEKLERVQNYNKEMGWGNAGPAWDWVPSGAEDKWQPLSSSYTRSSGAPPPKTSYVSGDAEVLVILINYTDSTSGSPQEHDPDLHNSSWFDANVLFNDTAGASTLQNYYHEVSYGAYNVSGSVAFNSASSNGWYTANGARAAYPSSASTLVNEAVTKANADINYQDFDKNGDYRIDHLIVVHAGYDSVQAKGDSNDIHSHRSAWLPPTTAGDGINYSSYCILAEHDPMGVFAHEYGHDIGLPDLYDTDDSSSVVGNWELMDTGSWNTYNSNSSPAHLGAWCKEQLGWVTPIVISKGNNNQGVHQVNQTSSATNDSVCYRVNIPFDNEYYLIENRNETIGSFDAGLPDRGILIWHIDDAMTPNDGPPSYTYYAVLLENSNNNANADNYRSNKDDADWSEIENDVTFVPASSPNSSANGGTGTTIYIDNITDHSLWNMTVRILVKDDEIPPAPPTNAYASDTPNDNGNSINVTWDNSTDDNSTSGDVTHYNIYINETGQDVNGTKFKIKEVTATGASSYETMVTGLLDGVTYYFCVKADDGPNESPCSNNVSATPSDNIANAPRDFAAADTFPDDGGNITLTWNLSIHDPFYAPGGDIQGYEIYQQGVGPLTIVGAGTTNYKVGNLTNGMPYTFNITCFDEVYNFGETSLKGAAPSDDTVAAPTSVNANPSTWTSTNSFQIDWNSPHDNSGLKNGAWYYLGLSPPTSQGQGTWSTNKPITVTNAPEGRNYIYIWLEDDSDSPGNRDYQKFGSTQLRLDTTAPQLPLNVVATPNTWTSTNSLTIDWVYPVEPAGDTSGINTGARYKLGSPPTSDSDGTWQGNKPIIVVTTEGRNTLYLWLEDNVGNIDFQNNNSVELYLDTIPPFTPTNLQASPDNWTNVNSFTLNWTNPLDDAGIKGAYYKLDAPPFGNSDGIYTQSIGINNLSGVTVSGEGIHPIHLWLIDNANNIDFLNYNSTTLYYDITTPTTPINVNVNPSTWTNVNSFNLTWTNPPDISGIKRVYYKLEIPPISDTDGNYVDGDNISQLSNIKVSKEGAIDIYIWLEDYAGNVNYLSYNSVTLYYDATPPAQPAVLIASPGTWTKTNSFILSWTNPTDRSGIAGAFYKLGYPPSSGTDGTFTAGIGINMIYNIAVPENGTYDVYVWLIDAAGNMKHANYATKELYYDAVAPPVPLNLTVDPADWTNINSFKINWLNPQDVSGVAGAFYKIGSPPRFDTDGYLNNEDNISELSSLTVTEDGIYSVYIWLQDTAGNINYSQNATAELRFDITAPKITHSKITSATEGVKVTVSAIITDDHTGINSAFLYYKNRNDNLYTELLMAPVGGDIYTTEIPAEYVTSSGLEYYIIAEDTVMNPNLRFFGMYGQTITKPSSDEDIDITVTIEDLTPPLIVHNEITSGTFGVSIRITAIITDDASSVSNVSLFYKNKNNMDYTEVSMGNSNPYMADIPSQAATSAGVEYYLKAVDKAPKMNSAYYGMYGQVTVKPDSTNDIDIAISDEDLTPPIITYGPVVSNITSNSVVILWVTDEPADSAIYLGPTADYNSVFKDDVFITYHNFILIDLTPSTTYHYQVWATDPYGNGPTKSSDRTFTTTSGDEVDTDGDGIADPVDTDDDNDGLPDDWEIQYGLDPQDPRDSERDLDGDGYSNRKEYLEGSDPLNRISNPITVNDLTAPIIDHTPVTIARARRAITITATVTDSASGVKSVTLLYKTPSDLLYTAVSMGTENPYTAEISGLYVNPEGLEYYIEAVDYGFTPNMAYYGLDGLVNLEPTSETDININVTGTVDDDDDEDQGFLEDIGEPFGITSVTTCILAIILVILIIVAIVIGVWGAKRRMAIVRREEEVEKDSRLEVKGTEDEDLALMSDEEIDWDGL